MQNIFYNLGDVDTPSVLWSCLEEGRVAGIVWREGTFQLCERLIDRRTPYTVGPRTNHRGPETFPQLAGKAPLDGLTRVVAAVIERDGRLLLCQRPAHKRHGGLWEFPGGKLDPGESVLEAVTRELDEELGVQVSNVGETLFKRVDPGSPYLIEFVEVSVVGEPISIEHSEVRWLVPEKVVNLPLAPTDAEFARDLWEEKTDDG